MFLKRKTSRVYISKRSRFYSSKLRRVSIYSIFIILLGSVIGITVIESLIFNPKIKAAGNGSVVGYYKLDESSTGSTFLDSSGYGNNITALNSPLPSTNIPSSITFPDSHSLNFNGSNQTLEMANPSGFNYGTATRSISAWIYPTAVPGTYNSSDTVEVPVASGACSYNGASNNTGKAFGIYIDSSMDVHFWGCGPYDFNTLYPLSLNNWYNITITYTGSEVILYVNGIQRGSSVENLVAQSGTTPMFDIGSADYIDGSPHYFAGNIDDVRVYNIALTPTEVSTIASGNNVTATWTGATSTNFYTASNWSTNTVPDQYTNVIIPSTLSGTANYPILNQATTVGNVTVDSGGILGLDGYNLNLTGGSNIIDNGTVISQNNESSSTPITNSGGTIMYTNPSNLNGLVFGNNYNNLIINSGLQGYWKLNQLGSGNTISDNSGYLDTGTMSGTINTPSSGPPVKYDESNSLNFNGTNNIITIPNGPSLNLSNNITVSAWAKTSSISSNQIIAEKGGWTSGSYALSINANGDPEFSTYACSTSSANAISNIPVNDGSWHLITGEYTGSELEIYVDGVLKNSTSCAQTTGQNNADFTIGAELGGSNYFNGQLADVRVYNQVLTSTSISNMYGGNEPQILTPVNTLNGNLSISGNLDLNTGTLDVSSSSYSISLGGNFNNNGGYFIPEQGTVTLSGGNQEINSSNTFFDLIKPGSGGNTLSFGQGSTTTVDNYLGLSGTTGNNLNLVSTSPGSSWNIDPLTTSSLDSLNIQDSTNQGSFILSPYDSSNLGNTSRWFNPGSPTNLGPANYINGTLSTNQSPTLTFTLPSSNSTSTPANYEIQISTNSNYASPLVDYLSGTISTGNYSFNVGQAPSGGTYLSGSINQSLSSGAYYWRVKEIDNAGISSSFVDASTSSAAFNIQASPPSVPGTPTTTSYLTSNTTPLWNWTASSDPGSSLASPPYIVEWSMDPNFINNVSSTTSSTNSITLPQSLTPGNWYIRVSAKNSLGLVSNYSANGEVTIVAISTNPSNPPNTTAKSTNNNLGISSYSGLELGSSYSSGSLGITSPNNALFRPITPTINPKSTKIILNEYPDFNNGLGQALNLSKNQNIYVEINNIQYTISIISVSGDQVKLSVNPGNQSFSILTGSTDNLDIARSNKPDISVSLIGTRNGLGQFRFAALKEPNVNFSYSSNQNNNYTIFFLILLGLMGIGIWFVAKRKKNESDS